MGLAGTLDLTASWLITTYVLVALLGVHGTLFDRWTKQVTARMSSGGAIRSDHVDRLRRDGKPLYLLGAMAARLVAIVYVMVTRVSFF